MRTLCWPDYSFDRASRIAGIPAAAKVKTGLRRPGDGRSRGSKVHATIRTLVNAGKSLLRVPVAQRAQRTAALLRPIHGNQISQLAVNFFFSLKSQSLHPLYAEFVDGYEGAKLATAIDLLAVHTDAKGRKTLSVVEVKTGGDNYFCDGSGPLRGPAKATLHNNCPLSQAFLQLAFCRQMLVDNYRGVRIGPCFVAQVRQGDTVFYELPREFISAAPAVRDGVCALRLRQLDEKRAAAAAKKATKKKSK